MAVDNINTIKFELPGAAVNVVRRGSGPKLFMLHGGGGPVSGMPFADLAQLFRSADLVAYPSYYEGQGLIPLEAMASGTPCVTVDDGPLPEMVDETVGALFELGSPSSLASAINDLLGDPEKLAELTAAGRERVLESYTYGRNAERYAGFYADDD